MNTQLWLVRARRLAVRARLIPQCAKWCPENDLKLCATRLGHVKGQYRAGVKVRTSNGGTCCNDS